MTGGVGEGRERGGMGTTKSERGKPYLPPPSSPPPSSCLPCIDGQTWRADRWGEGHKNN